jgi:hypothetical protein
LPGGFFFADREAAICRIISGFPFWRTGEPLSGGEMPVLQLKIGNNVPCVREKKLGGEFHKIADFLSGQTLRIIPAIMCGG